MFPEEKLDSVRKYLNLEFPDYEIGDRYEFDRYAQTFRLTAGEKIHLITFAREFLDDHTASEILNILNERDLKTYFQQEDVVRVVVTNSGVRIERKE